MKGEDIGLTSNHWPIYLLLLLLFALEIRKSALIYEYHDVVPFCFHRCFHTIYYRISILPIHIYIAIIPLNYNWSELLELVTFVSVFRFGPFHFDPILVQNQFQMVFRLWKLSRTLLSMFNVWTLNWMLKIPFQTPRSIGLMELIYAIVAKHRVSNLMVFIEMIMLVDLMASGIFHFGA